jgi:hypothetical protein
MKAAAVGMLNSLWSRGEFLDLPLPSLQVGTDASQWKLFRAPAGSPRTLPEFMLLKVC